MLRLLSPECADGPTQMAADEALLGCATVTSLRLYGWSPATVSLGYFQDFASVSAALPQPMPMVRRITGGGAIWHEHEVTYALFGILGQDGLPERCRDWYALIHEAILAAIGNAAIGTQSQSVGDKRYRDEARCFASPAADDLVHQDGGKILGSAARNRGDRVLLHGSLKLASNPWDGAVSTGCGLDQAAAEQAIITGICSALGQEAVAAEWTAAEMAERERIKALRYGDDAWVRRREGPRP